MAVLGHQLMNEEVGHELAHVVYDAGEAIEGWGSTQVLQVPEEKGENDAYADSHEPDDK